MKKILLGLSAFTMLFATSCQNELDGISSSETSTVSFKVGTPEIQSRAYSDGATATVLQYAVYNSNGEELTDLTVTDGEIHGSTTVELQLTTGNTYSVIFWAGAPDAPYTVDFANKTMTADYTKAVSNDEYRDAFYKYHTFTVKGTQTETIELKRPFAQLNIGTADYAASASAGYTPTNSAVTVKNVYNTLNLVNGVVENEVEVAYKSAQIPANETFPVAGYEYLAMNYLLVAADKALVDIEFAYTDGLNEKTRTVGSVPVQRNHRTNIYGNLLTSEVDINVIIKPEYDEPSYEADALMLAAAVGGEVTLTEDVELTEPLNITAGMILNMNGKTLTGSLNVAEGVSLTVNNGTITNTDENVSGITSNGNLTLNNVVIESARHALRIESGNVVINGGTYKVVPTSNKTLYALNVGDDNTEANVTIKGGTFIGPKGTIADSGAAVAVKAGSSVTIEDGDFSGGKNNTLSSKGTLTVSGGIFDQDPTTWLVEGYKAIENNAKWYVATEEIDAIATNADALVGALEDNDIKYVFLYDDIKIDPAGMSNAYGTTGINIKNGQTIDGGGNTLDIKGAGGTWDSGINTTGGLIKNLTVTGSFRGIFINHNSTHSEPVVLDNVIIDGTTYTISCDQGMNQTLKATNSTFKGWTSYAATLGSAEFIGCYFGEGNGYAYCRPYAPTSFTNCKFEKGFQIDCRAACTFENCKLDGVLLTAENIATLVTSNATNATVK